jgi:hypothetical protein
MKVGLGMFVIEDVYLDAEEGADLRHEFLVYDYRGNIGPVLHPANKTRPIRSA